MADASSVVYMPVPANNSFSGDTITVEFSSTGVSDVTDSNGNRSLNQQVDGVVTLEIKVGGSTTQTIRIIGPSS